jgi:hypothetical protein
VKLFRKAADQAQLPHFCDERMKMPLKDNGFLSHDDFVVLNM